MSEGYDECVSAVLGIVAREYQLSPNVILSDSKSKSTVEARQVLMYLLREVRKMSLPEIGRATGRRDHNSPMLSIRRLNVRMKQEPSLKRRVQQLVTRAQALGGKKIEVVLPPSVLERLEVIASSGCFGHTIAEAIERIVSTYVFENVGEVVLKVAEEE